MAEETELPVGAEPAPTSEIPAPEPNPAPEATAAPEGEETPAEGAEATTETPAKPKKTAEELLRSRLGHTTKQLSTKDEEIGRLQRELEAARSLVGAAPKADGEAPAPARTDVNPDTGRTYTQAEFEQAVSAKAAADVFNTQANAMYDDGASKFDDWRDTVETLNAMQLMTPVLLDAAMATDDGASVIHHLGGDLEEAQRIAALPPARMGAELARIAMRLGATKAPAISRAPAPAPRVDGAANPQIDLERISQDNDMNAYVAARAKQGSPWAQPVGRRGRNVN
jgi:hypothetical protein